jgi:hypothetical protein
VRRPLLLTLPLLTLLGSSHALALSAAAEEFIAISKKLEPVQCEKRKLRREIALAEIEQRRDDEKALRARFSALERDRRTTGLEKRLAELEPQLRRSGDPQDLEAISHQSREAFYRCD